VDEAKSGGGKESLPKLERRASLETVREIGIDLFTMKRIVTGSDE
jgi:hypothetical protein